MCQNVPAWLVGLADKVRELVKETAAKNRFRDVIGNWLAGGGNARGIIPFDRGHRLTLEHKYLLLAAVHDYAFRTEETIGPNPWEETEDSNDQRNRVPYAALASVYVPMLSEDDLPDLRGCLEAVRLDLQSTPKKGRRRRGRPRDTDPEKEELLKTAYELDGGKTKANSSPDDLVSTEVAISEYATSRATIRRMVKDGKLSDYRPPGSPKNATFRLSRAELGQLFVLRK